MNSVDVAAIGPVEGWLELAEATLDTKYGEGFARANPALLGALVQACALEAVRTALTDDLVNGLRSIAAR